MSVTNTMQAPLDTRVSPAQVELILSQIQSLPTLPVVASRLLEMTLDERYGTGDLAALVESDQTLSARVLSLVRRSQLGSDARTIDRAVVLLGCDVIRSLVLGVQVFELFSQRAESAVSRFDRVGFWRHSLAVGCAARLIANKRLPTLARSAAARMGWPLARPEEAFVCGLLHDLGKVVFDACFPKSYDRIIERVDARRANICDIERETFGTDHAAAGYRLADHWKLPAAVAECIWLHHHAPETTPTHITFPDHVLLVQAADWLVRRMHIGYSGTYSLDTDASRWHEQLGLTDELLNEAMRELPEAIELRAELLGLNEITSREVLNESLTRTNAELARLNAELALANRRLEQRSRSLDALCRFNRAVHDDGRHEGVLAAFLQAARAIAPQTELAALVASPARQLTVVGILAASETETRTVVLPSAAVGNLGAIRKLTAPAPAESVLPPAILDQLQGFDVGVSARCWPVAGAENLTAALVTTGALPDDVDACLPVLAEQVASRLASAESGFVNRRLTEEMAEINRRLVNSRAEVARMRSLAMVGEMAAGAAHELNNPLAVISGRAQLLARATQNDEVHKTANILADQAHRASNIVSELMDFAKPEPPQPTDWPLAPFLQDLRNAWLEKNVLNPSQFVLQLSDDLPAVHADAGQIRILFDEVIRNAVEAMSDRPDRHLLVNCRGDVADDRLVIRVEDNGCGMTPEVAEHAIDPFFSHRPAGRGRGLGLSRAARCAEINGGSLRLSSRVKEGTAVIVELPVGR